MLSLDEEDYVALGWGTERYSDELVEHLEEQLVSLRERSKESSKEYYDKLKKDLKFKEKRKMAAKKFKERVKGSSEALEKLLKRDRDYYHAKKHDPLFIAKRNERNRLQYLKRKEKLSELNRTSSSQAK